MGEHNLSYLLTYLLNGIKCFNTPTAREIVPMNVVYSIRPDRLDKEQKSICQDRH